MAMSTYIFPCVFIYFLCYLIDVSHIMDIVLLII